MGRADQLRAELAAVELEERLVALKTGPDEVAPEELREVKEELREARRVFREMRAAAPPEESLGDATVRPAPIKTKAGVKGPGGKA